MRRVSLTFLGTFRRSKSWLTTINASDLTLTWEKSSGGFMEKRDRGAEKRAQDFFAAPRQSLTSGWQAVDAKKVNAILVREGEEGDKDPRSHRIFHRTTVRELHPRLSPPSKRAPAVRRERKKGRRCTVFIKNPNDFVISVITATVCRGSRGGLNARASFDALFLNSV